MIGSLVTGAAGLMHRRFFLNAFLPALATVGGLVMLVAGLELGPGEAARRFGAQDRLVAILQVTGVVIVVSVTATLLSGCESAIIRLAEGYWRHPPGPLLARTGRRWHRRRLAALGARIAAGDGTAYESVYSRYPLPTQPDEVMPTRLGNVLKNAELHARDRYDIDAVLVWPRLFPLLPEANTVTAAQSDVAMLLTVALCAAAFAVAGGGSVVVAGGPWWLFLACLWGGVALAWLTYRAAVTAATAYGETVKVAFDVYRGELRRHLGAADGDEQEYWRRLGLLWYRNTPGAAARESAGVLVSGDGFAAPLSGCLLAVAAALGLLIAPLLALFG